MRRLVILFTAVTAGVLAAVFAGARAELERGAPDGKSAPDVAADAEGERDA